MKQQDESLRIYLVVALVGIVLIGAVALLFAPQIMTLVRSSATSY